MPKLLTHEFNELLDRVGEHRALFELGVHRTTLHRWQTGKVPVPKAVMYVMRDLAWGAGVDPEWEGWRFHAGRLHSPGRESFSPGDLLAQVHERKALAAYRREVWDLKAKLAALAVDPKVRDKAANDAAIAFVPKVN